MTDPASRSRTPRAHDAHAPGEGARGAMPERATAEALAASEERYRALVDLCPDAFWVNVDGRVVFANQAAVALLGAESPAQICGRSIFEVIHPRYHDAVRARMERVLREGWTASLLEEELVRLDGSTVPVEIVAGPITFEGRRGLMVIARDVSARKLAEATALAWKRSYEALLHASRQLFYDWDLPGDLVRFAGNARALLGCNECDLTGKPQRWVERIHPDDVAGYRDAVAKLRDRGEPMHLEYRVRHENGSWLVLDDAGALLRGERGGADRAVGVLSDVTERKALEAQLRHAQKMEAVGLLAGGVAHDFNNLLLTVQGRAELLLAGLRERGDERRQVEEIQSAAERAAHLTRQLLAFSRRQPLRPRVVDLNALVLDLADMLRRLIGEDVELSLGLDPALGRVRADPGVLDQVVMNLVVNARDAMPRGGRVMLETANVERRGAPCVALAVRDTGIGMDAQTRARIFEPYFTTKDPGRGTGLGLSTVDGIVRQSGGQIEVESAPGKGSTFRVVLPRVEGEIEAAPPELAAPAVPGGGETLLLVEDDDAARELLVEFFEGRGFDVIAAASGREALHLAEQQEREIRLLFTDLGLADMRGTEVAAALAAKIPDLRIVFVSGYTQETVGDAMGLGGRTAFLHKPFRLREAERRVRELLDGARGGERP